MCCHAHAMHVARAPTSQSTTYTATHTTWEGMWPCTHFTTRGPSSASAAEGEPSSSAATHAAVAACFASWLPAPAWFVGCGMWVRSGALCVNHNAWMQDGAWGREVKPSAGLTRKTVQDSQHASIRRLHRMRRQPRLLVRGPARCPGQRRGAGATTRPGVHAHRSQSVMQAVNHLAERHTMPSTRETLFERCMWFARLANVRCRS